MGVRTIQITTDMMTCFCTYLYYTIFSFQNGLHTCTVAYVAEKCQ